MAVRTWLGRAAAVAQVDTFTVAGTWSAGETLSITINSKAITHTTVSGATSIEDQVDALLALLKASDFGEFDVITWTKSGTDKIVGTGPDNGTPFTATAGETAAAGTFTKASTTTPTGPNWVDNVNNWDGGAVPTTGDDVHIENSSVSLLYGLSNISGNTLLTLRVAASFEGEIGLPKTNANGYPEYRDDYLAVDVTTCTIGAGEVAGSSRLKLDFGSVANTTEVRSTGDGTEQVIPACLLKGTNTGNVLDVQTGDIGYSFFGGEAGALATLRNVSGSVQTGNAMTQLTTVQNQAGTVWVRRNVTTITNDGGTVVVYGSSTVTTLTVSGGVCVYLSSGTITTLNLGGRSVPATFDASQDRSPRTITNTNLHENGVINDPANTLTHTNGIAPGSNVTQITAA